MLKLLIVLHISIAIIPIANSYFLYPKGDVSNDSKWKICFCFKIVTTEKSSQEIGRNYGYQLESKKDIK